MTLIQRRNNVVCPVESNNPFYSGNDYDLNCAVGVCSILLTVLFFNVSAIRNEMQSQNKIIQFLNTFSENFMFPYYTFF